MYILVLTIKRVAMLFKSFCNKRFIILRTIKIISPKCVGRLNSFKSYFKKSDTMQIF